MSVQGQFYLGSILLISLLAWITPSPQIVSAVTSPVEAKRTDATDGKLRRILTPLLAVITLGSLAYAFYGTPRTSGGTTTPLSAASGSSASAHYSD